MNIRDLDWGKHTNIGLDLDETLAATFSEYLKYAHTQSRLLMCKTIEDFTNHDIFDDPKFEITKEECIELWHKYGMNITWPTDTPLVHGSRKWVEMLRSAGKRYSIITARNGNDQIKKRRTLDWVGYYFGEIPESDIHFVNHYSTEALPKSAVCKTLGIDLMIDDHIENARDLATNNIVTILLEKPWNRHDTFDHPLIYRVKDWEEIIESLPHGK